MTLTREMMLARMLACDHAYDGKFITGVLSTGIYCLPSCKAKKPKPENVIFHATPEQARAAGLRPCRRCCPDDFYQGHHAGEALVEELAAQVARHPGGYRDVRDLTVAAGIGADKLHELFRTHYHTTPAEFLARSRVKAARDALLSTARGVAEIAFDVGFESLSAFNENFRKYSALTPQAFRRWPEHATLQLALPDGYPQAAMLRFLGRDPLSLTERVTSDTYTTVVPLAQVRVHVHVAFTAGSARCIVTSGAPLSVEHCLQLHERLLGVLGLHVDPARFEAQLSRDARLVRLIAGHLGLRVPVLADLFDGLIWAVLGQQITFAHACTLRRRLLERWGEPAMDGLRVRPAPEVLAALEVTELLRLGFTRSKAEYLIGAARAVRDGQLPLDDLRGYSSTRILRVLLAQRGLGPWSAQYLLMRAYGFLDCVPLGDSGLSESLKSFFHLDARPTHAEMVRLMQRFAPYRSLATFHFWRRLESFTALSALPVRNGKENS